MTRKQEAMASSRHTQPLHELAGLEIKRRHLMRELASLEIKRRPLLDELAQVEHKKYLLTRTIEMLGIEIPWSRDSLR